ncbi:MAG: UDP-glucose 6-dehydrogenase [Bacteriovoracaceae bacterium]|nr:UDP-glucose 6-dehydrogenase [Bacteriovoracaceae bacterium]
MEITIFGAGYVGLVTAAGLASSGNCVAVADTSLERIEYLKKGGIPIHEPGLSDLIRSGVQRGNLKFVHTDSAEFFDELCLSQIYFIAVGTPEDETGRTRLDDVESVVAMLARQTTDLRNKIVAIKSTVPVGTGDQVEKWFLSEGHQPMVVSNPEFLKQGNSVQDFLKPDRVIVGSEDERARKILSALYKPFMLKKDRFLFMKRRSAELVKYGCNAFLATKISFINELSQFSELVDADIREIREGMIRDPRIGEHFLFPGIGYGGSCFPKDVHSFIYQARDVGLDLKISSATDMVNKKQKQWPLEKLIRIFGKNLSQKTIALWGLSFKPDTDDLRGAPALFLIEELLKKGVQIRAFDPVAKRRASEIFEKSILNKKLLLLDDAYEAAEGVDAVLLLTEWREFRSLNFKRLHSVMRGHYIIDGRNIYNPELVRSSGFSYVDVGSPFVQRPIPKDSSLHLVRDLDSSAPLKKSHLTTECV